MPSSPAIGTFPETYDEDGTQHIITSDQRRGIGNHPVMYTNLLEDEHWLNKLRDDYNKFDDLKNSGRIFNGSDIILKNVEGEQFKDPNLVYNQSRYTIESSYIYIISKVIGTTQYYKVGEGGTGNKTDGPGRLGDAQTFLPFGLNNDVGFRVHYLLFFAKRHHPNVPQYLNVFIEKRLHANLRFNFRSASITFASGKASEWYLVPANDLSIFLGFIFDVVSSYKIRPLQIWKLTPAGKEIIKLDAKWRERMIKNSIFNEQEEISNVGTNIVIKHNYEEESGSVALFKKYLLGIFTLPEKQVGIAEQGPRVTRATSAATRKKRANIPIPVVQQYSTIDIIKNKSVHGFGQPLQKDRFYAIVTNSTPDRLVQRHKDDFLAKNLGEIIPIALSDEEKVQGITSKFYLHVKDLLEIHKVTKHTMPREFEAWKLKDIYNTYHNKGEHFVEETYDLPNNFNAPPWYFNTEIQLLWATKMTKEVEFMFHTDCDKNYSNFNQTFRWKSRNFFTPQFHGSTDFYIGRDKVDDNDEIIPNTEEDVPIFRVMNVMAVHEIQPTGKKRKDRKFEETIKFCEVNVGRGKKKVKLEQGYFVELDDDYFTYYKKNGETDDIANHIGKKTVYAIKKVYRKTNHSDLLNPWIDIQQYPSTIDKRIWCVPMSDFEEEKLAGKLVVAAKTAKAIENLKKKLLEKEAAMDKTGFDRELERVNPPKYDEDDIIRIKPIEFSTYRFGEDETKRDEFHYANISKQIKLKGKSVQYELSYFPPWNKNEVWGIKPEKGDYTEKHLISVIDQYAEHVEINDPDFLTYKENLKGRYVVENIYGHHPKYEKLKSHEEFIAKAKEENEEAFYLVKWEGYAKDVDNEVLAIGFYEDVPDDVKEYWKRNQPFQKRFTRSDTRRGNIPPKTPSPVLPKRTTRGRGEGRRGEGGRGGGASRGGERGIGKRYSRKGCRRFTRKGSLRSPKCPFRTHHSSRRRRAKRAN